MKRSAVLLSLAISILAAGSNAQAGIATGGPGRLPQSAESGCPAGTYSVVTSPDGTAVSIIFDRFSVESPGGAGPVTSHKACDIQIPLALPQGYSLSLRKVDYRGFSHLAPGQGATFTAGYRFGASGRRPPFARQIRGAADSDFTFSETIPPGLMWLAGCGENPSLTISAALDLDAPAGSPAAMVSLDSVDGVAQAMTYHFTLSRCRGR